MLVLGRKVGQEIWVGANVRITIIDLDGATVRLGIEAPRNVLVDRAEVRRGRERGRCSTPPIRSRPKSAVRSAA